jgi:hypothetical protein
MTEQEIIEMMDSMKAAHVDLAAVRETLATVPALKVRERELTAAIRRLRAELDGKGAKVKRTRVRVAEPAGEPKARKPRKAKDREAVHKAAMEYVGAPMPGTHPLLKD